MLETVGATVLSEMNGNGKCTQNDTWKYWQDYYENIPDQQWQRQHYPTTSGKPTEIYEIGKGDHEHLSIYLADALLHDG